MNSLLRLNDVAPWLRMLDGEWDSSSAVDFSPAVELREDEDGYTVLAELPGVDIKDVHVTLEDGVLTLSGEKKIEREEKNRVHLVERSWGSFSRGFRLGASVNEEKVEARFKDGVLSVRIPKAPEAKPREISIKS